MAKLELNNFTKGLTDDYISTDGFLEEAQNLTLDDDGTVIQRNGSFEKIGAATVTGHTNSSYIADSGKQILTGGEGNFRAYSYGGTLNTQLTDFQSNPTGTSSNVRNPPLFKVRSNTFNWKGITCVTSNSYTDPMIYWGDSTYGTGFKAHKSAGLLPPEGVHYKRLFDRDPKALYVNNSYIALTGATNPVSGVTEPPAYGQWVYTKDEPLTSPYTYTYIFAFTIVHRFRVDQSAAGGIYVTFEEESDFSPFMYLKSNAANLDTCQLQIKIPVADAFQRGAIRLAEDLASLEGTCYMKVYRTLADSSDLRFEPNCVLNYDSGTQSFVSGTPGAPPTYAPVLLTSVPYFDDLEQHYTAGGILASEKPPVCKYTIMVGSFAYYANIYEYKKDYDASYALANDAVFNSWEPLPNRVVQSFADDPFSTNPSMYADYPERVVGLGRAGEKLIVFTEKAVYRQDGTFDDFGIGVVSFQEIGRDVICAGGSAAITVGDLCYFWGLNGVYMTDGYRVVNLGKHILRTIRSLVATATNVQNVDGDTIGNYDQRTTFETYYNSPSVAFDSESNVITWTFPNGEGYSLNLSYSSQDAGSFWGPWKVQSYDGSSGYSAIGSFRGNIMRVDSAGNTFLHAKGILSDPIAANHTPTGYTRTPIVYRLRTAAVNFGSVNYRKWVNMLTLSFKRITTNSTATQDYNLDVAITSINDKGRLTQQLKPIHWNPTNDVANENLANTGKVLGVSIAVNALNRFISFTRRFAAKGLRCFIKQVLLSPGFTLVAKSDDSEDCVVISNTATLPSYPTFEWVMQHGDIVHDNTYFLAFDYDNYQTLFQLDDSFANTSTATLTLLASPTAGTHAWKLYSLPKEQFFGLISMGIDFQPLGGHDQSYAIADHGGNAGDTGEQ